MKANGMALITGLMLLAALSLLALAGASGMILQRHMATNFTQSATALQNADFALSAGQSWLFSRLNHEREADCISDCLLPVSFHQAGALPLTVERESAAWWQLNSIEAGKNPVTDQWVMPQQGGQANPARWIIEELHFEPLDLEPPLDAAQGVGYYRIYSRGTAGKSQNVAVTEAIIARPWGDIFEPESFPRSENHVDFCAQLNDATHPLLICGMLAWRQRR